MPLARGLHVVEERLVLDLVHRDRQELAVHETDETHRVLAVLLGPHRERAALPAGDLTERGLAHLGDRDGLDHAVRHHDVGVEDLAALDELRDVLEEAPLGQLGELTPLHAAVLDHAGDDRVLLALQGAEGEDLARLRVEAEDVVVVARRLVREGHPDAAQEGDRHLVRTHEEHVHRGPLGPADRPQGAGELALGVVGELAETVIAREEDVALVVDVEAAERHLVGRPLDLAPLGRRLLRVVQLQHEEDVAALVLDRGARDLAGVDALEKAVPVVDGSALGNEVLDHVVYRMVSAIYAVPPHF